MGLRDDGPTNKCCTGPEVPPIKEMRNKLISRVTMKENMNDLFFTRLRSVKFSSSSLIREHPDGGGVVRLAGCVGFTLPGASSRENMAARPSAPASVCQTDSSDK